MSMINRQITHLLLVFLSTVVLAACNIAVPVAPEATQAPPTCPPLQAGAVELKSETIVRSDGFFGIPDEQGFPTSSEPRTLVIDQADELNKIHYFVPSEDLVELEYIDFGAYFIVALLRELQGSSGYKVIIKRVAQWQDGSIAICAEFWSPNYSGPSEELTAEVTNYTHVVKVRRNANVKDMSSPILQILEITPTPTRR